MSRSRFVKAESVRIPLSDGDYIDIKKRLTHGEREEVFDLIAPFDDQGKQKFQRRLVRDAQVLAYLLAWSIVDDNGPVPMSPSLSLEDRLSTIRGLDPDDFDEIYQAIVAHEAGLQAARKNGPSSPPATDATSISVA